MKNFEEYWENFLTQNSKGNKVYDGEKFEKLTEELLTVMYGQKWTSTNTTHDGNKDFYLIKDDELLWAECKNYKDSIALNILAPTLVMAQVCDANLILFFSRSSINKYAKEKILAFGFRTSKRIIFYDAEVLENLILTYNHQLPRKFQISALSKEHFQTGNELYVAEKFFPSEFSCMITEEENYRSYTEARILHYNEPFSLMLVCCNNTFQDGKLEILFADENEDKKCFEFLNENITAETTYITTEYLQHGEGKVFLIHLRVTKFQPFILLPAFAIRFETIGGQIFEWNSNPHKVKCEWVGMTKLLGQHYNEIIERLEKKLVENNLFSAMLLSGSSGTGKSKILRECHCPLLKSGYRILNLNVMKGHSTNNLLMEVIYFLYEMPAEVITEVIKARINNTEYNLNNGNVDEIIQIAKMIDCIAANNFNGFMEKYKELLFEKMATDKIAVIIDNLQFSSGDFQEFWKSYVRYSINQCRDNKSILILSVNSDYMTEETAKTIYLLKHSNIRYFLDEIVSGFKDVNQGILFLRELIHTSEESYDQLFTNIIRAVSLNPFHLYQMVKLMEEDEVIKQLPNNQGYVFAEEVIWKSAWKVPKDIDDALERRFAFIRDYLKAEKLYNILSVCYILETIDHKKAEVFQISTSDLEYLTVHQILIKAESGYSFAHDIIRDFFERKYSNKRMICLENNELIHKEDILQYSIIFKLIQVCIIRNNEYIKFFCKQKTLSSIPIKVRSFFLEQLFYSVITNAEAFDYINEWISTLVWICNNARALMGSARALEFYKRAYDCIENKAEDFSTICNTDFRQFCHSHCDIYIQMHNREEAIDFAWKIIKALRNIPSRQQGQTKEMYGASSDEYYVLKAIMYNRIFCAYNNRYPDKAVMQKRDQAIVKSRSFIPFIRDTGKQNLICYLNDSDEGYRYYGLFSDYNKLISIWQKCLVNIPELAPEKTMNYYRKCVQYYLIQQNEVETKKYIKAGRDYLENGEYSHEPLIFNTFFTMAEAMCYLQHNPVENYDYIERLLEDLVKMQLLLKSDKMGDVFLLRGINAFYQKDQKTVYWAFKEAYQSYFKKETTNYWIKRKLITENILAAYSKFENLPGKYDMSFLPQECIKQLVSMQEPPEAQGIIRTKDYMFNLPLVV